LTQQNKTGALNTNMSGKELYILDFAEQDIPAGALLVDSIKQKVSSIMQMNIINCYHHGLSS